MQPTITKIENQNTEREEYDKFSKELTGINIDLIRCFDNNNLSEFPEALNNLKEFLSRVNWSYRNLLRRPLDFLHMILIARMCQNKSFASPIYKYDLLSMKIYANSEIEFRNLYQIYIDAIEQSLIQEA